jgi:hypothetical protein
MKSLTWCGTGVLAVLWSLLAWMLHGLVGFAGGAIASGTQIVPLEPLLAEWASWLTSAGTGIGESIVVALWAIGTILLFAGRTASLTPRSTQAAKSTTAGTRSKSFAAISVSAFIPPSAATKRSGICSRRAL